MLPKEEYLEMQSRFYDSLVNEPAPEPAPPDELSRLKRLLDDHWIDFDFSKKQPEEIWQFRFSLFSLRLAPLWFEWLKWVMMLAAIKVVATKSGSLMAAEMAVVSTLIMILYFAVFFQRIRIKGLAFLGSERWHGIVSTIPGIILGIGANQCALSLAEAVATMSK